jgi:putative nucleotidyltransferase with HDIG domain
MSARHILFVETEGDTLQFIMRSIADSHDAWHIVRLAEADAALEMLSQRMFCVVLTSFGGHYEECEHFLQDVQRRAPAVVRFALLPEAVEAKGSTGLESACQCFPTHCSPTEIAVAIGRGIDVWLQCQENARLTNLFSNLRNIPTPPRLYFDIREELSSPSSDARSVAAIICRDPAVSAKILKVANSGFYAVPRSVTDIRDAITFLGTDTVVTLVLASQAFTRMPVPGVNLDALWKHSLTVSAMAQQVAAQEGGNRLTVNTAGVAGLLHDIGELILLTNVPDIYYPMIRRLAGDESALLAMEVEHFGITHAQLGAHVLSLWSLPDAIVEAVALHHDGSRHAGGTASLINKAVFAAERFLQQASSNCYEAGSHDEELECCLGSTREKIQGWREACIQLLAKSI